MQSAGKAAAVKHGKQHPVVECLIDFKIVGVFCGRLCSEIMVSLYGQPGYERQAGALKGLIMSLWVTGGVAAG